MMEPLVEMCILEDFLRGYHIFCFICKCIIQLVGFMRSETRKEDQVEY